MKRNQVGLVSGPGDRGGRRPLGTHGTRQPKEESMTKTQPQPQRRSLNARAILADCSWPSSQPERSPSRAPRQPRPGADSSM